MAEAGLSLLRDPEKWDHFSQSARKRAVAAFPTEAVVARYREIYEKTLG